MSRDSAGDVEDEETDQPTPPEADDFWVDVASAELEPPKWIVQNLLPVGLVFIGGPAKTMKTTIGVGLANIVSGHLDSRLFPPFMSVVERSGRVMLLEAEAEPGELRYMIEQDIGVKLVADGTILTARDHNEFRLDDGAAMDRLLGWLETFKPRIFMVDPMREFHSLDEKDSGDMQRLLRPLRRWAIDNESCFLVIHHTTKPGEAHTGTYSPLDLRGSSALFGAANGILMVSPTKVEGQLIIAAQFKRGAAWTRQIQLGIFGHQAAEILTPRDKAILTLLGRASRDASGNKSAKPDFLAQVLSKGESPLAERDVLASLVKLHRNGLVWQPYGIGVNTWAQKETADARQT